jgi:hypothetical protein
MDPNQYMAMLQAAASNPQAAAALSQLLAAQRFPGTLYMPQQGSMMPPFGAAPAFVGPGNAVGAVAPGPAVEHVDQALVGQHHAGHRRPGHRKRKARPSAADEEEAAAAAAVTLCAGGPIEGEGEEDGYDSEAEGPADEPPAPVDRKAAALELLKQTGVPLDR